MVIVEQMNAFLTIAAIAAVSVLASVLHRWRLRQRAAAAAAAAARPLCWGPDDKPQRRFKHVLADNSDRPFKHLQREGQDKEMSLKIHPYEKEINLLLEKPHAMMKYVTSHECPDMGASYVWIHTEQQLEFLARLLSKEHVFAVDTEQHSVRSFLGFTALMQVSTEKEDFLIDTIALHDVMGILRPVFADPTICKVFHGSDSDVLWLQRDFHIYVVNMFDTAKACEVLSKPYKSLAYLLETYCGVSTDKIFQREDWRQRPLSQEMIQYARCDAHYLLYIADCLASELKNETLASFENKYNMVCWRSNKICLQLYVKENQSSPGVVSAESIYSRNFDMQGMNSSRSCEIKDRIWRICAWRDLMIVRDYFGGREISSQDLEMASLFGARGRKRRGFNKKRELPFKHSEGSDIPNIYRSTCLDTPESDNDVFVKSNESSKGNAIEVSGINPSRYDLEGVLSEGASGSNEQQYHTRKEPEGENAFTSNDFNVNKDQSDGTCGSSPLLPNQVFSKSFKNVPLVGHGPHGEQVTEHLLHRYGEDGINEFCRRWRQVFVEAVHPRFLPYGWDVMHSGQREYYGENSVYNPAKRDLEVDNA